MASSSATTRQGAARLTRGSQAATIALAGIAAAAFIFGVPGTKSEKPGELKAPDLKPIAGPRLVTQGPAPDLLAVADRFATIPNAPKPPPPPPADAGTTPDAAPAAPVAPPPPPDNIKYLGHVGLGSTLFAMISENQRQQMVGVNDELSAGRVVEITPDALTLDQSGTRKVIDLAAKSGSAISTVLPITATTTRGIRGGPRGQGMSPEDLMTRSRVQAREAAPVPQVANLSTLEQSQRQAWDDNFNTAMRRMLESGRFKDPGEAKQAAAEFADSMAKIQQDLEQGADLETIERQQKELSESLGGSPK